MGSGTEIQLRIGNDVVDAGPDDPGRNSPHGNIAHLSGLSAAGCQPFLADPDRHDRADNNAQGIRTDRQWAKMPHALCGARNERRHQRCIPERRSAASAASSSSPAETSEVCNMHEMKAEPTMTASA